MGMGASSSFETRLRYTPSTTFETFPWPQATPEQRTAIAAAANALFTHRATIVDHEPIGLTKLYNRVDDGAYTDLAQLHKTLDEAVAAAYGWPKRISQNDSELVAKLGQLNATYAELTDRYKPF